MPGPFGHGGIFSETPPYSWTKSVQWVTSGIVGAGSGYQSSTATEAAQFNHRTGAVIRQFSTVGKRSLGFGIFKACCIDNAGAIILGEDIVNPQPDGFGPTGWTAGRLLHKYDRSGELVFAVIAPLTSGTFDDTRRVPSGVAVDSQNNIYLSENYHTGTAMLRMFTPNGAQVWERDLAEGDDGYTYGVMGVPSGGCVVAFTVGGLADSKLARYDADGVRLWKRDLSGVFMPGNTGRQAISKKPSENYVAACFGTWSGGEATTALFSVANGATLWSHDHGEDQNHGCDIGGAGDSEAVFVSVIKAGSGDNFTMNVEKLSLTSGSVVDSVQTGSADLSNNTGYPIACTGDVVVSMIHDHHEFEDELDRWDEYNYNIVGHSQDGLALQWQKFWGKLSGRLDNTEGPYGELTTIGRAPG